MTYLQCLRSVGSKGRVKQMERWTDAIELPPSLMLLVKIVALALIEKTLISCYASEQLFSALMFLVGRPVK